MCLVFNQTLLANNQNLRLIVRMDDCYVSADSKTVRIIRLFEKHKTPINVGIIPFKNPADTLNPIYRSRYAEIFVHGNKHEKEGNDEFTGLSYLKQRDKTQRGKHLLESKGIYPCCFAPPWNGYDDNTLKALEKSDFLIISANEFGPKNNSKIKYVPSTCYSVKKAIEVLEKESLFNGIIVLLIHPYEFNSDADFELLEKLLIFINKNNIQTRYFSNLNSLDENITAKRLEYHHYPLFYLLRKYDILGFNHTVYYEMGSLITVNIIEWFLLLIISLFGHLKYINKLKLYVSITTGIILLLVVIIFYSYKSDSYRWVLLYKTSVIALFIWLNHRLINRKKLKAAQAT